MKVTISKTETVKKEVEISLPYFYDYAGDVIKLIDEGRAIRVSYQYFPGINVYTDKIFAKHVFESALKGTEITEEQFEQKLMEVRERIYEFIQQGGEVIA